MLDYIASQTAARIISHLLRDDTAGRERLARFEGRIARIAITPIEISLAIGPGGARAIAPPPPLADRTIDVRIVLPPSNLAAAFGGDPPAILRDMRIEGDADFAHALAAVLERLRFDPEEQLAPWVGDIAAVRMVAMLRSISGAFSQSAQQFARSAADYLAGERPILATRSAFDALAQDLARLDDDVGRLARRIDAIEPGPR